MPDARATATQPPAEAFRLLPRYPPGGNKLPEGIADPYQTLLCEIYSLSTFQKVAHTKTTKLLAANIFINFQQWSRTASPVPLPPHP